jgi:hypothetical protein
MFVIQVFSDEARNQRAFLVTTLVTVRFKPASQVLVQDHGDSVLTVFSFAPTRHVGTLAHRRVDINTIAHFCALSFSCVLPV